MSNNKKFAKFEDERLMTIKLISKLENEIRSIEVERADLIAEDIEGRSKGAEFQQSRRIKGALDRLARTENDLRNARTRLQVISEKEVEEVISLRKRAAEILNHSRGELINQEESCKERQAKLWREYNDTIKEVSNYHGLAEQKRLIIKDFGKMSDADILAILQNPSDERFRSVNRNIIEALGCCEEWEKARDKMKQQQDAEIAKARAEKEAEIKYLRKFKEQACLMIDGKLPWPTWLSTQRRLSINAADLAYFLRTRFEKEKSAEVN